MFDKRFEELTFTVFDTETTGMSPDKGARLVELAAVKVKPGLVLDLSDTYSTLIDPKTNIPYNAYAIHGINSRMVAGKPEARDILPEFFSFAEGSVVAAHNAKFDCAFINHHSLEAAIANPLKRIVDTVKLAKAAHKGLQSYSLGNLIHHFEMKIPLPDTYRHRALFDAAHTALLLTICLKKLSAENICTVRHLFQLSKSPVLCWE